MMSVLPTFDFINHVPFSKRNMAEPSDPISKVVEWIDWFTLSEPGEGKLFPPSLEAVDMADEAKPYVRSNRM